MIIKEHNGPTYHVVALLQVAAEETPPMSGANRDRLAKWICDMFNMLVSMTKEDSGFHTLHSVVCPHIPSGYIGIPSTMDCLLVSPDAMESLRDALPGQVVDYDSLN
jgi:hypothetical protein